MPRPADMYKDGKLITRLADIPTEPHWAILETTQYSSNDGWGGTDIESKILYTAFNNEKTWKEVVTYYTETHRTFRAIVVRPAEISIDITVK